MFGRRNLDKNRKPGGLAHLVVVAVLSDHVLNVLDQIRRQRLGVFLWAAGLFLQLCTKTHGQAWVQEVSDRREDSRHTHQPRRSVSEGRQKQAALTLVRTRDE